ncbi:MAG: hypothetical protein ACJATA_000807 [Sphingobacteriales bacterium]|jgi:hypothetical protein
MKNLTYNRPLIIAVDFDGTIVEHRAPKMGKPLPGAFETLKALKNEGHRLILWTYRDGDALTEAIDFCRENGLTFFAINNSFPHEEYLPIMSRKINADIFIDDRNVGGFVGWAKIRKDLLTDAPPTFFHNVNRQPAKIGVLMRMMNINIF